MTTHYLDEAERCHRVALIHAGRLAAIGTTTEVKRVFEGRPILEIRADKPVDAMRLLEAMPDVEKTSLFGTAVHAVLRDARRTPRGTGRTSALVRHCTSKRSPRSAPSLEDVFLDVIDKASRSSEGTAA